MLLEKQSPKPSASLMASGPTLLPAFTELCLCPSRSSSGSSDASLLFTPKPDHLLDFLPRKLLPHLSSLLLTIHVSECHQLKSNLPSRQPPVEKTPPLQLLPYFPNTSSLLKSHVHTHSSSARRSGHHCVIHHYVPGAQNTGYNRSNSITRQYHAGLQPEALPALMVKTPPAKCGSRKVDPWVGKTPWRRNWQPPPAYSCLEKTKSHGQREEPGGLHVQPVGSHRAGRDCAHRHRRSTALLHRRTTLMTEAKRETPDIRWLREVQLGRGAPQGLRLTLAAAPLLPGARTLHATLQRPAASTCLRGTNDPPGQPAGHMSTRPHHPHKQEIRKDWPAQ